MPGVAVPEQESSACEAISWGAGQDQGLAIRVGQKIMGSVDRGLAFGEQRGIAADLPFDRRNPGLGRVPFQEEASAVTAHEEAIALSGDRVALAIGVLTDPFVLLGVVAEKAHGKGSPSSHGPIRGGGHAHDVGAFAGIVETRGRGRPGLWILHLQDPLGQVAPLEGLAVRELGRGKGPGGS